MGGAAGIDYAGLYEYALSECQRQGGADFRESAAFYRRAGPPAAISDREFLQWLAQTIVWTGFAGPAARRVMAALEPVFHGWDVAVITADPERVRSAALAVFRHKGKVEAILSAAIALAREPGIGSRLGLLDPGAALRLLQTFAWIGATNSGWLARAIGIQAVTPDRFVSRLAQNLGHDADSLCRAIAAATGERPGVVDFVLWYWVDACGAAAFAAARMFRGGPDPG